MIKTPIAMVLIFIISIILINIVMDDSDNIVLARGELKCISNISTLYVREGCIYCDKQKDILGDSIEYFNIIDCKYNVERCGSVNLNIYPTWFINGYKHGGYLSAKKLKELSGC